MAGKIFISYRRDDDPGSTGRLYDWLEKEFGRDELFMDVEGHIRLGDNFVQAIDSRVELCEVMLAVIGRRWLGAVDQTGQSR